MNSNKSKYSTRRQFIKNVVIAGTFFPVAKAFDFPNKPVTVQEPLEIHIFSKHLQFLGYKEMAETAAEAGFDGVDLTVRPGGHVLPERAAVDLPKAVEAVRSAGLKATMITTSLSDPGDRTGGVVLKTASDLGITNYRMGYFRYLNGENIPESILYYRKVAEAFGELNRELGIVGCYQNHAGNYMGASMWELWQLLDSADSEYLGVQYDIRHAVVEGGLTWGNGFQLISPSIKTLAFKDFIWQKTQGQWSLKNVPIGEGMVDFRSYFQLLKEYRIQVPVSMHYEYPLGGAEHGSTDLTVSREIVIKAMKRDLKKVRQLWRDA